MSTIEDTTRLPQWAQRKIAILEDKVKSLQGQISQLNGDKPSDLQWSHDYTKWRNIPMNSIIRIHLDTGDHIDIYKDSQGKTRLTAGKILVIKPGAANSVFVESEEY